jgi:hypothetical protein
MGLPSLKKLVAIRAWGPEKLRATTSKVWFKKIEKHIIPESIQRARL